MQENELKSIIDNICKEGVVVRRGYSEFITKYPTRKAHTALKKYCLFLNKNFDFFDNEYIIHIAYDTIIEVSFFNNELELQIYNTGHIELYIKNKNYANQFKDSLITITSYEELKLNIEKFIKIYNIKHFI